MGTRKTMLKQDRLFIETDTALAKAGDAYLEAKDDAENAKSELATSETALISAMREAQKKHSSMAVGASASSSRRPKRKSR